MSSPHVDVSPPVKVGSGLGIASPPAVMLPDPQPFTKAGRARSVVRRLTPLECERLQGYDDDHTRWRDDGTEIADSTRYRMCGNGVASPVAHYVASCVNRALESEADGG